MNRRFTSFLALFLFQAVVVCGQTIHNMTPGTYSWACAGTLIYLDRCITLNNTTNYGVNCSPPNPASNFNYQDNQLMVETICTSNGQCLSLNPSGFPATWGIAAGDTLWVYAGNVPTGTPLAMYTNIIANPVTTLSCPQPCVTFKFQSDNATNCKGWRFDITCITCPSAPVNDSYTGAIPLSVGSSCTYTTGNTYFALNTATCSTAPACTGALLGAGNPDDDVWYRFTTGPSQTSATVQVNSLGTMDAVFQVFSGTCGSFSQITCQNSSAAGGFETSGSLTVLANTTYYVRVYDYATFAGSNNPTNPDAFQICVTGATGNDCAGSGLVCSTTQISHTNTGGTGTQEFGTGSWGCLFGEHNSAWYLFKANANGSLSFNIASNGGSFEDIDFGLWGPFASANLACSLSSMLSSSYAISNANPGCGLPNYSTGLSVCETGGTNCENAGGNGSIIAFNQPVAITLNSWYLLLVDVFAGNPSYFLNWVSSPPIDCLLPIDLLSFTGQNNGEFNTLNWTTASEEDNNYFVLERSADAENFSEIATIPGAGNSYSELIYAYKDQYPVHGINYYRLKQIDVDGSFTYSGIVMIDNRTDSQFSPVVYPNPGFGIFNVDIYSKEDATGTMDVFNSVGQLIMEQQFSVDQGHNLSAIDLSGFNEGVYTLRMSIGKCGEIFTKKLVKL